MRPQFRYNLISIKAVFTGVIMATIVFRIFNGDKAVIEVGKLSNAPVNTLWLYLILGMILAVLARCLIRWCCAPRICSSGSTAATLKNGC
ncbi:H(+)/Cl(-) exchange transporter ClcA [Klebsiella michiganensis]|nr:H(+)/Cl(-) exchange transporter ClcA [Klebsiella michiganensis]